MSSLSLRLLLGVLAFLWVALWNHQRIEWSINPQYAYGWSIPLVFLALCATRAGDLRPQFSRSSRWEWPLLAAVAVLLFAQFPIRLVEEANPEWRLLAWFRAAQVVAITLAVVAWFGGRASVRLLWFPIVFTFFAVPWPMGFETALVQWLMRSVSAVTVEIVRLLGIPAVQQGNLITIPSGVVGVDEACSGVRSFQCALMVAVLLGELSSLSWPRRLALVAAGLLLAPAANVARTLFLVWRASVEGIGGVSEWHDAAGLVEFGLCFAGVCVAAWLLGRRGEKTAAATAIPTPESPSGIYPPSCIFTTRHAVAALTWLVLTEGAVEVWYRLHEQHAAPSSTWSLSWPDSAPGFVDRPLEERTRAQLLCDEGRSASWKAEDGSEWMLFHIRWHPGHISVQSSRWHHPAVCLPAAGWKMVADHGTHTFVLGRVALPFRHHVFEHGGTTLHAYQCFWEERPVRTGTEREDGSYRSRWEAVSEGRRNLGQQMIEFVVSNPAESFDADAALDALVRQIVQPLPAAKSDP